MYRLFSIAILVLAATGARSAAGQSGSLIIDVPDSGSYGFRFDGITAHRDRLELSFQGSGTPLSLSLTGYDIDAADEVTVTLNGSPVGQLATTPNNGSGPSTLELPLASQTDGTNTLAFVQKFPGWTWGVTDLLLSEVTEPPSEPPAAPALVVDVPDSGSYGFRFDGITAHRDRLELSFQGSGIPLSLSLTGYDIDAADEVTVTLNGSPVGQLATTPNNGSGPSTLELPLASQTDGTNTLAFVQKFPGWTWGVTDLLLSEVTEPPSAPAPWPGLADYEQVFADEFDSATLDASKWYTAFLWGPYYPINEEQQLYVDTLGMHSGFAHTPFEMTGETLKITAMPTSPSLQPPPRPPENSPLWQREHSKYRYNGPHTDSDTGFTDPGYRASDVDYLSGIITSYDSFKMTHGYVEARAKLPAGRGLWPAFWMLPTHYVENVPEIDVMEFLGHQPDRLYNTYHFFDVPAGWQLVSSPSFPVFSEDWTQDFHTFGMEWTPRRITWYVDGVETHSITDRDTHPSGRKYTIANQAMYLLANLAVGGTWPGNANATTPFPATYEIDYIRAYKKRTADPIDLARDYQIMFRDEFDGNTLDPAKWNSHLLWGPYLPINSEEQYYVDALQTDSDIGYSPFSLENGILSITARAADDPEGIAPPPLPGLNDPIWTEQPVFQRNEAYVEQNYTSGVLTTYDSFRFANGYAEIRARLPKADGLWPAFWLLNTYYISQQPEIDIMEARGRVPAEVEHHYHRYTSGGVLESTGYTSTRSGAGGYTDGFHTYGVRWRPGKIDWYVDGVKAHTYSDDDVAYQLMYVILNLAVGGSYDPGVTPKPADFPAAFEVDYVRVYQEKD